jgi:hypothetical protein
MPRLGRDGDRDDGDRDDDGDDRMTTTGPRGDRDGRPG